MPAAPSSRDPELLPRAAELAADMERALTSPAVIDQAKSIAIAERGCTAEEAFEHLVTLSSSQQLKLRDAARLLVERKAGGTSLP